ncbi:MAG: PHB depolymerase family esterase, partial [Proteobacteria bacterium]|nr:PHB depolymerase family esterase [Pseudomonadota bacterium]
GAIVLYPFQNNDASSNDNDGRNPNCWGYWFDANLHRDQGEPGDIKRMVDYMKSNFTIDSNRVHLTGISSGGAMTVIGQTAYPDVFASSVVVEGIGYGETSATYTGTTDCQTVLTNNLGVVQANSTGISKMRTEMQKSTLRQPPVLVMHNKKDCTVPIKVGQAVIDNFMGLRSADGLGISSTPTSTSTGSVDGLSYTWSKYGSNGNGQSLLETILFDVTEAQLRSAGVVDMTQDVYDTSSNTVVKEDIVRGHWWSGAPQRGPWIINKGLNAAKVAVDFFNAHPMNGSGTTTTSTTSTTAGATTTTTVAGTTTTTQASNVQAGPGAWSSQQTWAADSVNGGNLTGYFYWPSSQPANSHGRALVMVLHGCSQTASGDVINDSSDGGFNWKTVAEQYGAVVLAPNATGNISSVHCWNYSDTNPTRTTSHVGILLDLINRFKNDPKYAIDPNQVYVTGLSSGGGMTMVLGCIAPDVFAGIGINAGPAPGTTTSQIGAVPSGVTSTTAGNICKNWAGSNANAFNTQITSVVWGSTDYTVGQAYGPLDAGAMRYVYGGAYTKGSNFTVTGGSGNGTGIPYTDASGKLRTTEITVSGMAHAWPAGPGGQNSNYVDSTRINYPAYVMDFWFNNNLRLSGGGSTTTTTVGGTTTTTASGGTTTTSATTTTLSTGYDQTSTDTVLNHYIAGRLNVTQYTAYGSQYGYSTSVTIYHCPSLNAWTDSASCSGTGPTATTTTTAATTTTTAATTTSTAAATTTTTQAATTTTTVATTTTTTAGACYKTSNYAHVQAGRAHDTAGTAYANGSNAKMGLDNAFYTTKLRQTGSNYYVIDASCP